MELLQDCPLINDAGYTNIVFIPDTDAANKKKQGHVYRIAKFKTKMYLLRYSIDENEWEKLGETLAPRNLYLTLVPFFSGRIIAILGDIKPYLFDTRFNEWVEYQMVPGSHPIVPRQYSGAFQLPYKYHRDKTSKVNKHLEFLMFNEQKAPLPHVQHISIDLIDKNPGDGSLSPAYQLKLDPNRRVKAILNVGSLTTAKLTLGDYFPLNHTFFLEKPIHPMFQMGITAENFDKMRFVAAIGASAFHVFDLETMQFICHDTSRRFRRTISN